MTDRRAAAGIGREARLELAFERRQGRTIVAHAYAEPPFRIGRPLQLGDASYLIVVCSGPGIFAGDALRQSVTVASGARVVLTSQSALQVHPSPSPAAARLEHQYCLDADAELHCHWDPIIPFAGARIVQRYGLHAEESSRFSWSDALMSGRVTRGETWRFDTLDHELRLVVSGVLRYLERYRVLPGERALDCQWAAGDANYFGTMLVHHARMSAEIGDELRRRLEMVAGVRAGVDLVDPKLLLARLAAGGGAAFRSGRAQCRSAMLSALFESPELAGRPSV